MSSGLNFLSNTASTAIGVGLGTSLTGLPLAAINRYMQLSTVLEQVGQRFREASDGAEMFGTGMGYGIARSAQLSEALGRVQDSFSRSDAVRMAGFGRHMGADPGVTLSALGTMSHLQNRSLSSADMAQLAVMARELGMGQGRFEEFLHRAESATREEFALTGRATPEGMMGVLGLPSILFGAGDPRRTDESIGAGLNSVITSSGPMRSYMMRAMGYGKTEGPSYIEMRKRLEAGVYDARNVDDLFSSFQARGMGEGAQFRAIESVAGGALKAWQIEALVKKLGTSEGLDEYRRLAYGSMSGEDSVDIFRATLSEQERRAFDSGGMTGLGRGSISAGEAYENKIESMLFKVGGELAPGVMNIQDTLLSVGRTLENLVGDFGTGLERATGILERIATAVEHGTEGPFKQQRQFWGDVGNELWNGDPTKGAHMVMEGIQNRITGGPYPAFEPGPSLAETLGQTVPRTMTPAEERAAALRWMKNAQDYEKAGGGTQ